MKHIILSLALIFTITLTAQDPIVKEVGEFTALKVYDLISVELVHSDKNEVVINGKNTPSA